MSRRKLAGLLLGAVVLSSAAGWVVGTQIRSPAEIAAGTAAPEPSPILVPVEERVLSTDVVTRGTARFDSPQQLSLPPSALKGEAGIVAAVPLPGAQLSEGDVLLTASGRPIFLLEGIQPSFRDLGPGIEGTDVRQLEAALVRFGFDPGPVDGVYDEATEAAVAAWYRDEGFAPFEATQNQLAAIRSLEAELAGARLEIIGARDSVTTAEADLAAAREAQTRALAAPRGGLVAVAAARAEADAANDAAAANIAAKQAALEALQTGTPTFAEIAAAQAELDLAKASEKLAQLEGDQAIIDAAASGTPGAVAAASIKAQAANVAAAAEVKVKQLALDAVLAGTPGTPAEIAAAEADLATAKADAETTWLAGQRNVAEVSSMQLLSGAEVENTEAALQAAEDALANARATLSARYGASDLIALDLGLSERRAGVQVPADEVIFVTSAVLRVSELAVVRGDAAGGALMTATDTSVAIDGSLRLEEAPLVEVGMTVQIEEPELGIAASGVVSRVADAPGTNGVDGFHVYFEIVVDEPPANLVGASVRLIVPIESTGEATLAVPISALSLAPDGSSRVQLERNGVLEFVRVEPDLSAEGFVAVTPLDGALAPGDLVVIGFELREAAPGG